jgi:phosphohistidine phosphatase
MKTLLLLRHAKSSWDDASMADFDRPLNARGERDAPRVGEFLREKNPSIDLVVCSPAVRARETAAAVLRGGKFDVPVTYDERIYEAALSTLFQVVGGFPESAGVVLMVGHNPGFEELLSKLTGRLQSMATAALACLELPTDRWSHSPNVRAELRWFQVPRSL